MESAANVTIPLGFQQDLYDTGLTACSAEFCPLDTYRDLLVCGTYQLDKETEERSGALHLLSVSSSGDEVNEILRRAHIWKIYRKSRR
jgi:hypothetical protein